MNNPAKFDPASLAIVKPGVDSGLLELQKQLEKFWVAPPEQSAAIQSAQNEAKRISGVFQMVGLQGLAVYCTEIAAALAELANHPASATQVHRDGIDVGVQALVQFLDDLAQGVDNATMRLFPTYQQLQHMRGLEMSFEQDLFFPNLEVTLPASVLGAAQAGDPSAQIKAARAQYQQALVRYLRRLDPGAALQTMQQAMLSVMTAFPADQTRAYWWIAAGFFDCLNTPNFSSDLNVPKLLGRLDQQMRLAAEAKMLEDQHELYQMLYVIAAHPLSFGEIANEINQAYALQRYVKSAHGIPSALMNKRLSVIGEHLQLAEESWDACIAGSESDCVKFINQVTLIEQYCEKLDHDTLQGLARSIAKYAQHAKEPDQAQVLGLDMAMALLLMDRGVSNYHRIDADFQHQAQVLAERMHDAIDDSAQDKSIDELVALYCGQESTLIRSLMGKEMLGNLHRVEAGLTAFFADSSRRDELHKLIHDIKQIEGGLFILGLQSATTLTHGFRVALERISQTDKPVERVVSRTLASTLGVLEGYLSNWPHTDLEHDDKVKAAASEIAIMNQGMTSGDVTATMQAYRVMPAAAPSDEDVELIEIFLEEADEVLAIMRDNLDLCRQHEASQDALVTIRRGFHTLKGSGRMVGLNDLGEVAWALERAMNFWIKNDLPVTDGLLEMIAKAIPKFGRWVSQLRRQGKSRIDGEELVRIAQHIENGEAWQEAAGSKAASHEEANAVAQITEEGMAVAELPEPPAIVSSPAEAELPSQLQIGSVNLSGTLFKIGSEESTQHVQTLQEQFAKLSASGTPQIEYDFMRAAHTLAGVNRAMGFTAIVELAYALESWLQTRMEHPFRLEAGQLKLLHSTIGTLERMVQDLCARQFPKASSDLVYLLNMDKDKLHVEEQEAVPEATATLQPVLQAHPIVQLVQHVVADNALVEAVVPTATESKQKRTEVVRDDVDEQLLPIFMEEADDLAPKIDAHLRAWRTDPDDVTHVQALNRLLHTLKGSARMAGAMRIGQIAHEMEDEVLSGDKRQRDASYWDGLEHEFDRITALIEELRSGGLVHKVADVTDSRQRVTDHAGTEAVPDRRALDVGAERVLQGNMLRVRADVIDRLVNEASEISVARARMEGELRTFKDSLMELTDSVVRLRKQLREVEIQAESQIQARVAVQGGDEHFDPLEFDRFTRLQELTRFMNESVHDVQTVQQGLLKNLDATSAAMSAQARLNRELQQGLMNVRMVPFNSITDRLYRIVRQTGKELDKRANLELAGTSVELDRSVLEKMTAPFEHLLRNAMAHGLENEQQRVQIGKQPIGEIRLSLRQENNEVVFELSDDGAGLNLPLLRERAIKQGLLQADDQASEEQLAQLIFASGISTANEVTEVAGRGIGMDVVRSEITSLGGRIDVSSQTGQGTRFIIHLPLTLAVTQVLMVRSGDSIYAIPAAMVEQVRQVKAKELQALYRDRLIEWQGKSYSLHYLPQLLGGTAQPAENQLRNSVLLLRSGEVRMALHIDELLGNQEAVVKNIGPQLARMPGIAGATVRGDGKIVLILNPLQISQSLFSGAPGKPAAEKLRRLLLVMVVDDSLTVRKITTRMLTRAGYEVVTAKDGLDALEQLAEVMPDVMLLDVEMPRMDGFELTKRLRQESRTRQIPIIMITSRTADKHRDHAMQLGVNAYLGKPYQEDELLARIAGFVAA